MALSDLEGLLSKLAPGLTPPIFLMYENKFPNLVEVFATISKNPPEPCSHIAMKYLYLCRITGVIWLMWALNFTLFLALSVSQIIAWGGVAALASQNAKLLTAAGCAVLFVCVIVTVALLRVAIELRDVCYRLCNEKPKPAGRTRRSAAAPAAARRKSA
jgi:hypothetical protein